ncbi:alpha/beta hydrolase [Pikeienuella piscinae]|uniref:Alpha/beta hydrolase n=1 Tax=Pikeienuella piscinae TaxID=2748098 RepID=A0A7L5C0Z1_9RHOB|nr:alpha/beta fold hydrolase [Pikeienuella piscinae]QIE57063.1 alpha/beta hydrolase [Pikeienuella piscinae]
MRAAFAVLLLAVAGCVGGPAGPAPPLGPVEFGEGSIAGASGRERLALSTWTPEGPLRGVILALHGFGDYGPSTFDGPARYWAARGFLTFAYDQRGFGRNESRGRWPGAERLIADFREIAELIRGRYPDLPLFVVGHSMGGGVALAGVGDGAPVDGLILAAPAVWGGDRLPAPYRVAAWGGTLLFPDRRWTGKGIVSIQASDNIDALIALGRDPLYLAPPSSREFTGLIRLMDRAVAAAPHVRTPTLTLYGEKDEVAPKDAVLAAHEALAGPKTLILYPEGWHLLFRDLQAEHVWRDVVDWMEARS